ncbi:hypothetical protein GOP47_0030626, partial [Adiantum capillus-veneris]
YADKRSEKKVWVFKLWQEQIMNILCIVITRQRLHGFLGRQMHLWRRFQVSVLCYDHFNHHFAHEAGCCSWAGGIPLRQSIYLDRHKLFVCKQWKTYVAA